MAWQPRRYPVVNVYHEVDLINYCGMAAMKVIAVMFFLLPYIAIRLVLRKRT